MSALANRDFVKMNGLGNEIVIVDLRAAPSPIAAAEARAAARREPYDQLMALYPPDGSTDAFIRIYNNDGSEAGACGNGMRCVAELWSVPRPARRCCNSRPRPGSSPAGSGRRAVHGRYGPAALSLERDSAVARSPRHARHRSQIGSDESRSCIRRRSSAWAIRTRFSGSRIRIRYDLAQHRAAAGT